MRPKGGVLHALATDYNNAGITDGDVNSLMLMVVLTTHTLFGIERSAELFNIPLHRIHHGRTHHTIDGLLSDGNTFIIVSCSCSLLFASLLKKKEKKNEQHNASRQARYITLIVTHTVRDVNTINQVRYSTNDDTSNSVYRGYRVLNTYSL